MIITEPHIIESRMATCNGCDQLRDASDNPLYFFVDALGNLIPDAPKTMCAACGCSTWVKVRIPVNGCPLNKWAE